MSGQQRATLRGQEVAVLMRTAHGMVRVRHADGRQEVAHPLELRMGASADRLRVRPAPYRSVTADARKIRASRSDVRTRQAPAAVTARQTVPGMPGWEVADVSPDGLLTLRNADGRTVTAPWQSFQGGANIGERRARHGARSHQSAVVESAPTKRPRRDLPGKGTVKRTDPGKAHRDRMREIGR